MRSKEEILGATIDKSRRSTGPLDISLIHNLHTLEVLIDIRDILQVLSVQLVNEVHNLGVKE